MVAIPPHIFDILEKVYDPEVPVLTIHDLGILREVNVINDHDIEITITPTYSGCPAMQTIATMIRMEFAAHGFTQVKVKEQLSPAWTTDWMTEAGKNKLREYGIAPPQYLAKTNPATAAAAVVPCPRCESIRTELLSEFGSTSCKSLYRCTDCLEPFDYFKCH
jgi:ring-1,2-phenylacetyl-CoA epoxidase subunit PaaD